VTEVKVLAIMIAGGFGTLARYGLGLAFKSWFGASSSFPLATLVINVSGSFILSWITSLALQNRVNDDWRLLIGTGFCSAFTTFSTFELETHALITKGLISDTLLYVFGNLILGFLAVLLGIFVARGISSS
jgi:fluoride exporter